MRVASAAGQHALLYVAELDDLWSETPAAIIEADPYEEEPETLEFGDESMSLCLAMDEVSQVLANVVAQLPDASDDVICSALRYFVRRDAFMVLRIDVAGCEHSG